MAFLSRIFAQRSLFAFPFAGCGHKLFPDRHAWVGDLDLVGTLLMWYCRDGGLISLQFHSKGLQLYNITMIVIGMALSNHTK